MSKYFTLSELTASQTAAIKGISNTPGPEELKNLEALAKKVLDPVRELWGRALYVTSGYRCTELNKAVGGAAKSQHVLGEAADINTGEGITSNKALFNLIAKSDIPFDQLIDEKNYQWIHISYGPRNRRQILHLK